MLQTRIGFRVFFAAWVGAVAGCAGSKEATTDGAGGVSRTASADGVELTVTVAPAELPFDQRAKLLVEVTTDSQTIVEVRPYEELIREAERQYEFRATPRSRNGAAPRTGQEGLVWRHEYDLEFFLPGTHEIPGAVITYFRTPNPSDSAAPAVAPNAAGSADPAIESEAPASGLEQRRLETEAILVTAVATPAAQASAEDLESIKTLPPVELAEPWSRWWIAALASLPILLAALLLLRLRRKPREASIIVIPADEWARRELAALVAADLIAKKRMQEFYYRISDILRGYIERRFDVHAREMTTEEFLTGAARDARFGSATDELRRFLTACDMVKYARMEPEAAQADAMIRIVGEFVERTRIRPELVGTGVDPLQWEQAA